MVLDESKIKVDPRFISHLREEKLAQQDRRAAHVRSKFTFVVGLFSLATLIDPQATGSLAPANLNLLIFLVPLVSVLFDLYILGGEFAVKRLRGFLSEYDLDGTSEQLWDKHLKAWPKSFMRRNRLWVSCSIYLISILFAFLTMLERGGSTLGWVLFSVWILVIILLELYLISIERLIKRSRGLYS